MKLKKAIGFLVFIFMVLLALPSVSYAEEQQYTENLIPAMTSDTSPSGEVSSSKAGWKAWHGFDHSDSDGTLLLTKPGWLAYEFPEGQVINKYSLQMNHAGGWGNFPANWTFEAWDGETWNVLDKRTNIEFDTYMTTQKMDFYFDNNIAYKKYRINISETKDKEDEFVYIAELEMMGPATIQVSTPSNLAATPRTTNIDLKWDAIEGAESYNIKRSETAGGPYTTLSSVSGSAITLTDDNVENGKTYYYVVSAVKSNTESNNSNEASATLKAADKILKLVLEVKQTKQLSVSEELSDNADMIWASSDTAIASVDDNGKVKAIKPGNTLITSTSKDGEYTETINVLIVNLDLQLAVDLSVGEKCRLTVDDLKNTAKITWTADDPTIATVTSKGKVTAVSEGLTYITAMDDQGKEIGRIYIRVRK